MYATVKSNLAMGKVPLKEKKKSLICLVKVVELDELILPQPLLRDE